jgi:hypothetical protein
VVVVLPWVPATTRTSFSLQELFVQDLGKRAEWNALIEHVLELEVSPRNRIAHDDQIRVRLEILGGKRRHLDAQSAEKVGHRGVGSAIGAADRKALLLQHAGERGHGRAADADQVNPLVSAHG